MKTAIHRDSRKASVMRLLENGRVGLRNGLNRKEKTVGKNKELPKKVFIYEENAGTTDEYYQVEDNIEDCAEVGRKRLVGEYQLVKTGIVSAEVKMTSTLVFINLPCKAATWQN